MSLQAATLSRPLPPLLICANLQRDELDVDTPGRCDDSLDQVPAAACALAGASLAGAAPEANCARRVVRGLARARSDWLDAFRPMPGELVFEHALPSAYSSSRFAEYMRNVRPETSIFAGLSLDQTILSSAVDGFHRGYRHHIVADAVDTSRQPPASPRHAGDRPRLLQFQHSSVRADDARRACQQEQGTLANEK